MTFKVSYSKYLITGGCHAERETNRRALSLWLIDRATLPQSQAKIGLIIDSHKFDELFLKLEEGRNAHSFISSEIRRFLATCSHLCIPSLYFILLIK